MFGVHGEHALEFGLVCRGELSYLFFSGGCPVVWQVLNVYCILECAGLHYVDGDDVQAAGRGYAERSVWQLGGAAHELDVYGLGRAEVPVGGHADNTAVGKGVVDLEEVAHVRADGYHPDIGRGEGFVAVFHDGLFLAAEYEGVELLAFGCQVVAGHLVVADMGAELQEALGAGYEVGKCLVAFDFDLEASACIEGEPVDNDLAEEVEVAVCGCYGGEYCAVVYGAEISVDDSAARGEYQAPGDDEDCHEGIYYTDIGVSEHAYQFTVHPPVSESGSGPTPIFHFSP